MPSPPLPNGLRARVFAADELVLDIWLALQSSIAPDLESVLILVCVSEATMQPLLLGPDAPLHLIDEPAPSNELRGAIARRAVADRTGLARETVRRKTEALIAAGWIEEDAKGRVRTTRTLDQPRVQKPANDIFAAVKRYQARRRQLGDQENRSGESAPGKV